MRRTQWSGIFHTEILPLVIVRGFFSHSHCKDMVQLLQIKLTKMWGPHITAFPWSSDSGCPPCASDNSLIAVRGCLLQCWSPQKFLFKDLGSGKLWFSISFCLSLYFLGQQFALQPHFSAGANKSCDFGLLGLLLV